jgi:hypothetical protein
VRLEPTLYGDSRGPPQVFASEIVFVPTNSIVRFGPAKRGASARLSAIPPTHNQPCGCPMRVREGTLLHEGEQRVHDPRVRLQVHPMLLAQAIGSGKPQLGRLETSAGQGKEGGNADSNMVEFL